MADGDERCQGLLAKFRYVNLHSSGVGLQTLRPERLAAPLVALQALKERGLVASVGVRIEREDGGFPVYLYA